jgi:predicted nucleotidyltransferase
LDLLIDTQEQIPLSTIAQLKESFEESDLPFHVDIVLRTDISPEFYRRIQEDLLPLCDFHDTAKST